MLKFKEIDSLHEPSLEIYTNLSENQLYHCREPERGLFIAESPKVIGRALDAGYKPVSMLAETREIRKEASGILKRIGDMPGEPIPVYTAEEHVLRELTGFPLTRGCLCAMERRVLPSIGETVQNASRIVVLEQVVNPTNVGAIFRSAAALGMDAVLLTHGCSDPLYRRAIRVSMGTVFQIPFREDSVSITDPALLSAHKLAVVLGTEGDGLAADTIASCDHTVMIPMYHGVDSLNVAAASAVAFWQLGNR